MCFGLFFFFLFLFFFFFVSTISHLSFTSPCFFESLWHRRLRRDAFVQRVTLILSLRLTVFTPPTSPRSLGGDRWPHRPHSTRSQRRLRECLIRAGSGPGGVKSTDDPMAEPIWILTGFVYVREWRSSESVIPGWLKKKKPIHQRWQVWGFEPKEIVHHSVFKDLLWYSPVKILAATVHTYVTVTDISERAENDVMACWRSMSLESTWISWLLICRRVVKPGLVEFDD